MRARARLYCLGYLAFSSSLKDRNACVAADVPEAADMAIWLKQLISGLSGGRNKQRDLALREASLKLEDPSKNLLVGRGSTVAGVAFAWKTLLCWCTDDVELASTATDLGFLSFLGCFSLYAITEQFRNTRIFLLQAALSHIFLETVFEFGVVPKLDPKAKPRMALDMVIHHIGSLAIGLYCTRVGGGKFSSGEFLKQGARLVCTEITTGFPVAFKAAIKKKKFKGKRRLFFALGMPAAFIWRSLYTLDVLKSFLKAVESHGGREAIPSKWVGAACFSSVVGCNVFWTFKILSGVVKTLKGAGKKKKKGGSGGSKEANNLDSNHINKTKPTSD